MRKRSKMVEKRAVVNAPKGEVYRFFTDRREWKEWLCDKATGAIQEGEKYVPLHCKLQVMQGKPFYDHPQKSEIWREKGGKTQKGQGVISVVTRISEVLNTLNWKRGERSLGR